MKTIKVASSSNVKLVAGSIAKSIGEEQVVVSAVGAGAVNQALKSIAMARGFLSVKGMDLYVAPGFASSGSQQEGQKEITVMNMYLKVF